jgi:hypothetical protein
MFSPLYGAERHSVLDSQVMANVHGQKLVVVVNFCPGTAGSL